VTRSGLLTAAWQELSVNRGRTLLSMASVIVGVMAVALTVAMGDAGRRAVELEVERTVGRPATMAIEVRSDVAGNVVLDSSWRESFDDRLDRYGVSARTPIVDGSVRVGLGGAVSVAQLNGVYPDLAEVRRLQLVAGRWLSDSDGRSLAPVLVVNERLLRDLGGIGPRNAVGSKLRIGTLEPVTGVVVGVMADTGDAPAAYTPLVALERWGIPASSPAGARYLARVEPGFVAQFARLVEHSLSRSAEELVAEVRREDNAADFAEAVRVLRLVLFAVAAISLVTGGIGILNVGLVSVRQRVREFGIRRSFGATRRDIFTLVLVENLLVTTLAGLVGVAAAVGAGQMLPSVSSLDPEVVAAFPWGAATIGVAVSVLLGLAAGIVPARRATRVDVIDAIRQ
jgi:putative ABC transport system permease protein